MVRFQALALCGVASLLWTPADAKAYCCCDVGLTWDGTSCVPCIAPGLEHGGQDCTAGCASDGVSAQTLAACNYCGPSGKCCQQGVGPTANSSAGGDVCSKYEGAIERPVCVSSEPLLGLLHEGTECFVRCGYRSGACAFCGSRGRCCRREWQGPEGDGGDGVCAPDEGGVSTHVCIGATPRQRSCDAPELIHGSSGWLTCSGNTRECSLRDGHSSCCCEEGYRPAVAVAQDVEYLCEPCAGGLQECPLPSPLLDMSLTLQCHPSQHIVPCNPGSSDGPTGERHSAVVRAIVACLVAGLGACVLLELMPRLRDGHFLRKFMPPFQKGDRVRCAASAEGRFQTGDLGTVQGIVNDRLLVALDKGGADAAAVPVAPFCLQRVNESSESLLAPSPAHEAKLSPQLEAMLKELFRLQDLNGDGMLEEMELVKINEKIALLHYGKEADKAAVREKYQNLFRAELSADGRPVAYPVFRGFMRNVLLDFDRDETAQEMILEQFIEEARSARVAFYWKSLSSESDAAFMPKLSLSASASAFRAAAAGASAGQSDASLPQRSFTPPTAALASLAAQV